MPKKFKYKGYKCQSKTGWAGEEVTYESIYRKGSKGNLMDCYDALCSKYGKHIPFRSFETFCERWQEAYVIERWEG